MHIYNLRNRLLRISYMYAICHDLCHYQKYIPYNQIKRTNMYRQIEFMQDGVLIDTFKQASIDIKANTIKPLHLYRLYIYNDIPYYIMNGKGSLDITHMPYFKPCFNKVEIENLRFFMENLNHITFDYDEQQQIELFYKIHTYNEQNHAPLIYNDDYMRVERLLYGVITDDEFDCIYNSGGVFDPKYDLGFDNVKRPSSANSNVSNQTGVLNPGPGVSKNPARGNSSNSNPAGCNKNNGNKGGGITYVRY